jgi:hypothetical protein
VIPCVASVERRSRCVGAIPCRRAVEGVVVDAVEGAVDGGVEEEEVLEERGDNALDSGVTCVSSSEDELEVEELLLLLVPPLVPVEMSELVPELVRSPCVDPGTTAAALLSAISRVPTT